VESWCERWNIKINEDKAQAIYFSRRHWPVETVLPWTDGTSPL
jgi:hypothetical protein